MADTGWLNCSAWESNDGWSNPNNFFSLDGAYANTSNNYGIKLYNFNISIPPSSTIDGIEIRTYARDQYGFAAILKYQPYYSSRATAAPTQSTQYVDTTFDWWPKGGASDLWGRGSWAVSDFSNTNFAVHLLVFPSITIQCDVVQVKVYYTLTGWSAGKFNNVSSLNILKVNKVARSNISKINGV